MITETEAALWTDGRYFLQAEKQLDPSCWKLMKQGLSSTPTITAWISSVCLVYMTVIVAIIIRCWRRVQGGCGSPYHFLHGCPEDEGNAFQESQLTCFPRPPTRRSSVGRGQTGIQTQSRLPPATQLLRAALRGKDCQFDQDTWSGRVIRWRAWW